MMLRWIPLAATLLLFQNSEAATITSSDRKSVMHPAFKNAGKKDGVEIWRIESFEPKPLDTKNYGVFHEGDSYIVLATREDKSKKGTFSWDIYFWLGDKTSQDESGAAAILSVELDDGLGGSPVQHREVQSHESAQFLGLFKSGVRYLPGGVASGFQHVDINAAGEKRLYQVKGKKNIRVRLVQPDIKSMNTGDCFILDTGRDLYVWVGGKAKGTERLKAISAANQIRDQDHNGRVKITIIDTSSTENEVKAFFSALGSGSPSQVAKEAANDDDLEFEKNQDASVSLYKISDAGGKLVSEKLGQKPLSQNMLKAEDCFILDTVTSGIYVWIGKGSTTQEKVESLKKGQAFLSEKKYPSWTKMQRVVQGAEPSAFKEYFTEWRDAQFKGAGRGKRSIDRRCGAGYGFMPDDGEGEVDVYRIDNLRLRQLPTSEEGVFYGGDCYVVKYRTRANKYIIYVWQGKEASSSEKSAAVLQALQLDEQLGGRAIQIRVEQGEEPAHFNSIFHGNLVIFTGGYGTGLTFGADSAHRARLFQIRGTCEGNIRAIQLPPLASFLNTNDVFLVESARNSYIWQGNKCNEWERQIAQRIRTRLCPEKSLFEVREGYEPEDFWNVLEGERSYVTDIEIDDITTPHRLYHCFLNENDKFKIEEIGEFDQRNLFPDDVMILDSGEEIYVWVGNDATPEEKRSAYKLAQSYTSRRDSNLNGRRVVVELKQGEEPQSFTDLFPSWDNDFFDTLLSYDEIKNQINDA